MRRGLRVVLRVLVLPLVAVAAYLVFMHPTASVLSENLGSKTFVEVKCNSVWEQRTHHGHPAQLNLNGTPILNAPPADSACTAVVHKLERVAGGLVAGAVGALVVSFVPLGAARARRS